MYRIRSTDGLEADYGSLEEFSAAVRRGEVTPDAEIFHVRANRWLDIKSHPHYRLACSAPSSPSSAPAAVAAPPATPVPVVPRAAAAQPQPRPQHTTLRPQLQSEAPHASAPPAPAAPPKKSNDLVFVDVPGVKAPGAPQKATIIQAQRAPEPKPASPPPLKMEAADQFLVMDTGLESPVRTSKGVRIIKDDLDLLFDQPAPEGTAASPNVVTPVKPLNLTPAQPPVDVIPLAPPPAPEPPKPVVERPAAKAAPEAPARPATVVGRIPVAEPPKAAAPAPAPAAPAPKPVEPARPVVEKKPEPAPAPVAPAAVKPAEPRPAPVAEAKAPPAPQPEPVKPVVVAPKVEPAARVEPAPSTEPAPKPEPKPAPAARAPEVVPHVEPASAAVDLSTAPHEPVPAPVPSVAPTRGSRLPLIAAGVVAVLATGVLLAWKPWAKAPATDVTSLAATLPPGGEAQPTAPAPTRVVPDANAPSFGSTAPSVPAPKPAPSQATTPAPVQPAPAATTAAPKDSAKDEEIIAVTKPVLAPMTLNAPTLDLGAAPGSSTSAAPSAVAPSALARNIAAAERTAQQDLAARLGSAGFRAVLAPARLGTADGVAQAKASWSQGAEALRQYRARIGRIEKAYEDSALASQRAERWPASELRAWAAHPSVAEPGETSQVADLMVSQVSEALDLLAGAAGQYEIRNGAISFRSPATAVRYTAIRTWVEQKTANWNATPEGARPHTITALLRALGDGLPPSR